MATARGHFNQELQDLKAGVLQMGSMVEQAIGDAMRSLTERDSELARRVIAGDQELNELNRQLREQSFTVMATQQQVHAILGAVIDADEDLARAIAMRDDEVDDVYHRLWKELLGYMTEAPNVERAAILLFAAKDLERIADRVTNIAEDVVFLHTGHVVELS